MDYGKDYETVLEEMQNRIDGSISKGEGSLVSFALAPAAAEFEELYNNLEAADENSSPLTCDREHLLIFGTSDNIPVKEATAAVWLALFNEDFEVGERFECNDLTYISIQRIEKGQYYLQCETTGTEGNKKPDDELLPIEFISEKFEGELVKLVEPAEDEEETEAYRERYLAEKKGEFSMSGNRAAYKKLITSQIGVAAVKMVRVTEQRRRINAYILSNLYGKPEDDIVAAVQQVIDPIGQQGDGAGEAPWWHVVDIYPVEETIVNIAAAFTVDAAHPFDEITDELNAAVDELFLELNKIWENEDHLVVRTLRVAERLGAVAGVIDVRNLTLNGSEDNLELGAYAIPVRGVIQNDS